MPTIRPWMLGRNLTSVLLTPLTIGTAGTTTEGTVVTLTTVTEGITEQLTPDVEDIRPVNSTKAHHVPVSDSFTIELPIIKVNDGGDPNPLKTAFLAYDYFKLAWTEGTGGSAKTVTLYASRGPLGSGIQGYGKQVASASFNSVDAGGTTWYVVS